MSISRRSVMTAFLPIAVMPGLASAAPVPSDPALSAYRAVMARKDAIEALPNSEWHQVESWCEEEIAALDALAEQNPRGLAALLNRVVLLAERLDGDASWNLMDGETELLRALGQQARAILAGTEGAA